MKYLSKIVLILSIFITINESKANTLMDSLKSAYLKNPKLNAERAKMKSTIEEKRESISEFLPSVTISGYIEDLDNTKTDGSDSNFEPTAKSMIIEQKIFQGGSGVANFKKKKQGQKLAEFNL